MSSEEYLTRDLTLATLVIDKWTTEETIDGLYVSE